MHQPIENTRARRAVSALLALVLATTTTLTVAAGGNQERPSPAETDPPARTEESTRINIEEGNAVERDNGTVQPQPGHSAEKSTDAESATDANRRLHPIQQPAWAIFFHDSFETLQEEVSTTIDRGYLPVGLEANPDGSFSVLYLFSPNETPDRWLLESYGLNEDINSVVSARIVNGWNPLAFSAYDDTLVAMFGRGTAEINDWRIHRSELTTDAIVSTLQNYQSDGYTFVDFGIDDTSDQVWYLFVQQEDRLGGPTTRFFVNAYPNGETLPNGISQDYESGKGFPFGIASGTAVSVVAFVTAPPDL